MLADVPLFGGEGILLIFFCIVIRNMPLNAASML